MSVRSEESILLEASKKIENIVKTNLQTKKEPQSLNANKNNEDVDVDCLKQIELKKQVLIGEITPFEAIEKQSKSFKDEGYTMILKLISGNINKI